jgi:hypothetical protein
MRHRFQIALRVDQVVSVQAKPNASVVVQRMPAIVTVSAWNLLESVVVAVSGNPESVAVVVPLAVAVWQAFQRDAEAVARQVVA